MKTSLRQADRHDPARYLMLSALFAFFLPAMTFAQTYSSEQELQDRAKKLSETYASFVHVESIGKTAEGRDITVVTLGSPGAPETDAVVICGEEARAWIAPAACMGSAEELAADYNSGNARVKAALSVHRVRIIPLANPDGYAFTRTTNRMWRKNRVKNPDGSFGVDLGRNWNAYWGVGSSSNPSTETYRGTQAFSERETESISNYISANPTIRYGLIISAFGQMVLAPPAGETTSGRNVSAIAVTVANAMRVRYGATYVAGTYIGRLYPKGGTALDWLDSRNTVALRILLGDKGHYGFVLPPSQIPEAVWETKEAVLTILESK